jgi:hypothetical protein
MQDRRTAWFLILAALFLLPSVASAGFSGDSPIRACNYLVGSDIQTEGYQQYHGNTYGCEGSYQGAESSLKGGNYLTYQVMGTEDSVEKLELALSVMADGSREQALSSFADLAEELFSRALERPLPGEVRSFIQNGEQGIWELEEATVDLTREGWSSGNGFDLILVIK